MSWRTLFYAAAVLLWVAVVGAGLEVYEVFHTRSVERAAKAWGDKRLAEAYTANAAIVHATAADAPQPPPALKPKAPPREAFAALDEEGRVSFATQRRELILVCDSNGTVLSSYAGPESKHVAEMAALVRVGEPLSRFIPAAEGQDALNALRSVLANDATETRDYAIALPSGNRHVFEFCFRPLEDASGATVKAVVFVGDSIWEEMWLRFRKHAYKDDGSEFWTNGKGFRDEETALPKPPGVYRIACIGGSTTAAGPRNDLTYPNMLERKLRDRFDSDAIEVINCGIFALGSYGERQRFPDYLELDPDLIVHYNFVNDVTYGLPDWMEPASPLADPVKSLKLLLRKSAFVYRHFNWWLLPSEKELTARIERTTIENLRLMCAEAREAGAAMAICSFAYPDVGRLDRRERDFFDYRIDHNLWGRVADMESYVRIVEIYNRLVRGLCEREGVLYIPVAENISGGADYFSDTCHMHLNAMELKAGIVFDSVRDYVAAGLGRKEA